MPTLGQRLAEFREHLFVGRESELSIVERWLQEIADPPTILNVTGIGGSGKTALLHALLRRLASSDIPSLYVDGTNVRHSQHNLEAALEPVRHVSSSTDGGPSVVLLVDSYEEIHAYDRWFRESFLSQLDSTVRVVLAGRFPIDRLWMAADGWAQIVRTLPIGPLADADAREYLCRRGVDDEHRRVQLLSFARGHLLALCLATDMALRLGCHEFATAPQRYLILQTLTRQILAEVEDRRLRDLLEAASMVRQFDEETLSALVGADDLTDGFEQLICLSLVRPVAHGLAVHDVVRRSLIDELRWRNPTRHAELRARALAHYAARFRAASPDERHWLVADWLSLSNRSMIQDLMFDEGDSGDLIVESARRDDEPALRCLRARWGEYLNKRGYLIVDDVDDFDLVVHSATTRLTVARSRDGTVVGYSAVVPICRSTLPDLLTIPRAAAIVRSRVDADELANLPLSPDAVDTFFVWHLVPGPDVAPAVQAALLRDLIGMFARGKRYLSVVGVPENRELLAVLGFRPIPEVSQGESGNLLALLAMELDVRALSVERWVEAVLTGDLLDDSSRSPRANLQPALQDALSRWSDDAFLATSPLLRIVDVDQKSSQRERAKALRDAVCRAFSEAIGAAPAGDQQALRAVELAYLQRATSHERLAERLSVSRSTLYRMLHRGCRLLATRLADARSA